MGEGLVAEVHVHAHFDLHAVNAGDVVEHRAQQNHAHIHQQVDREALQRAQPHKAVQRIALEDRDADVHNAPRRTGQQHDKKRQLIGLQPPEDPADAEKAHFPALHTAASPAPDWMAQMC